MKHSPEDEEGRKQESKERTGRARKKETKEDGNTPSEEEKKSEKEGENKKVLTHHGFLLSLPHCSIAIIIPK